MFGQLKTQSGKILLWLLAIAILGFVASLIPQVRRHLPWFQAERVTETKLNLRGDSAAEPDGWAAS